MIDPSQFQQMPMAQQSMMQGQPKQGQAMYAMQGAYPDGAYQTLPYDASQAQQDVHYTTVSPQAGMMEQQHGAAQNVFPTPPMQHQQSGRVEESSPEAYSPDAYQQQDLADLLGTLKVDEAGTGKLNSPTRSMLVTKLTQAGAQHRIYGTRPLSGEKSSRSWMTTMKSLRHYHHCRLAEA
jgi:hypothetical protein